MIYSPGEKPAAVDERTLHVKQGQRVKKHLEEQPRSLWREPTAFACCAPLSITLRQETHGSRKTRRPAFLLYPSSWIALMRGLTGQLLEEFFKQLISA
jgi:hypothetical protein